MLFTCILKVLPSGVCEMRKLFCEVLSPVSGTGCIPNICSTMSDITSSLSVQLCVYSCVILQQSLPLKMYYGLRIQNCGLHQVTYQFVTWSQLRESVIYSVRNVVKSDILFMYCINILFFVVVYLLEKTMWL